MTGLSKRLPIKVAAYNDDDNSKRIDREKGKEFPVPKMDTGLCSYNV